MIPERLVRALDGFETVLAGIPAGSWDVPSPCEGWSAVEVAEHVILALRGLLTLATGLPGEAGQADPGPADPRSAAGPEPLTAWRATRADLTSALNGQALPKMVSLPWGGEMALSEFIGRYPLEIVVHTWDLAQATGQDIDVDPELVRAALVTATQFASAGRAAGMIGPERTVPEGADDLTRLLAIFGRAQARQ